MRTTFATLVLSLAAAGASAENPPYLGCIVSPSKGIQRPLAFNAINFQKIWASPDLCAKTCQNGNKPNAYSFNNDYPLVALDDFSSSKFYPKAFHFVVT